MLQKLTGPDSRLITLFTGAMVIQGLFPPKDLIKVFSSSLSNLDIHQPIESLKELLQKYLDGRPLPKYEKGKND
jgi:hypothetical protein